MYMRRWSVLGSLLVCFLLLPVIALGLQKLLLSPTLGFEAIFLPKAIVEQLPTIVLFLACGFPGLLWSKDRSIGYFVSSMLIGVALLFSLTAGEAMQGNYQGVLPSLAAFMVAVLFASAWCISGRTLTKYHQLATNERIEPPLSSDPAKWKNQRNF
jgi:hypothetical protein